VGDNRSIITYSVPVSGAYYIKINRIYNDNDQELGFYDIRISLNEGQLTQTPVINTSVEAGESVTVTGTANFGNIEFYINGKALDYLIYLDSNYEFVDVAVDGDNWEVYNLPLEPGDVFSVTVQAPDKNISLMATATAEAVPVTGISLDISALNLTAGAIETLTAAIEPANASNQNISWTSSDNSVATVNNGTVTAVSEGTATVSAITADGAYEAHCTVNVVNREQDAPVGLAGAAATRPKK